MDAYRWQRLRGLFDAALDLEVSERPVFVARSCGSDAELRNTLESLLSHSQENGSDFHRAMAEAIDLDGTTLPGSDLAGCTLGHYQVLEKIGEGGMGEVYRATDTRLDRDVAIKTLPEVFTRDPERLLRFQREARALASLSHPNIATIHGLEEMDGIHFLVLELVHGATLRSRLADGGLDPEMLVQLASQIADGLAMAHQVGIVHRDLKPDNLMLTDDGVIKILDFGLARAIAGDQATSGQDVKTAPGRIMGTASYMSPEQARGEAVDHRSDQFSFGSLVFEMATGKRAFAEPSDPETMVAVIKKDPQPPDDLYHRFPEALVWLMNRCLAKRPEDRFESTHDLARHLRALAEGSAEIKEEAPAPQRMTISRGKASASLAVLPLANLGPSEHEYFADGMTDALITHLAKIQALKVISHLSVLPYKGPGLSLPSVARELGVDMVLTGSVLHAGDKVRISAYLTKVASNENLWAESYERQGSDILALQSEVASTVARTIRVQIDPQEEARMATSKKIDPKAYDAYLRGLSGLEDAYQGVPDLLNVLETCFQNFQRAIELEPTWAMPRGGLACGYRVLAGLGKADVQAEFYPRAKATALSAIGLDEAVARAHIVLGLVQGFHEWNWPAGHRAFRRAAEIYPNLADWPFAVFLMRAGHFEESIERYQRAKERFPRSPVVAAHSAQACLCAGLLKDAENEATHLINAFPGIPFGTRLLGLTRLHAGRYEEAVRLLEEVGDHDLALKPTSGAQELPVALAKAGRVEEAQSMLQKLEDGGSEWHPDLYWVLGQKDKALAQIEAAYAMRDDTLLDLGASSEYQSYLENPRLQEIVNQVWSTA